MINRIIGVAHVQLYLLSQSVHDVITTLYGRWNDVKTLKRRRNNIVLTSCFYLDNEHKHYQNIDQLDEAIIRLGMRPTIRVATDRTQILVGLREI